MQHPPSTYYRVSAKALVFDDQHRLLVFRNDDDLWEMPGGGWEHGESFEECLTRELYEEARAVAKEIQGMAFCYLGQTNQNHPKLNVTARVQLADGQLQPHDDDIVEARYVSRDEFMALPFEPGERSVQDYADQIWQKH